MQRSPSSVSRFVLTGALMILGLADSRIAIGDWIRDTDHWSLQPVKAMAPPAIEDDWIRGPLVGLAPDGSILDVGCGAGRIAIPLTRYLSQHGRYVGFDVISDAIEWCRANITSRCRNFEFHHLDRRTKRFNLDLRSISNRSWREIRRESRKCILLCSNCHKEEHNPDAALV